MPAAVVKSLAKQSGLSLERVERYWGEAKAQYPGNWSAVTGTVRKRCQNAAKGGRRARAFK